MRRIVVALCAFAVTAAAADPPWPSDTNGAPSVTDPSIPLTYVGNDASVSLGINAEGETEGQILGVFARSNEHATVGQLWWDRAGAGGIQTDFNWLLGISAADARLHPDRATVARLSFAIDQNADHDRKATVGFGIERSQYSIEAYLAGGISGGRRSDTSIATTSATTNGSDAIGDYTIVETTTAETVFDRKPYGAEIGLQASHVFESTATRVHGGFGYQHGDAGASANTVSIGVDTPLGTHGWGMSAMAEHVARRGRFDIDGDDDRVAVFLRYEFGAHGSFAPTASLENPAWITRALARPSTAHSRVVESYRTKKSETVTVTRGPKQYTNHFPVAANDSASGDADVALSIAVLANDGDADGDPISIVAVTAPAHGSAAIAGATIVYTPDTGFAGTDTFSYTISDGHGGSASANVSVAIAAAPNRAPVAAPDAATTSFGASVSIPVLDNDSDADGDPLSIVAVTQPSGGRAVVSGARIVFTPDANFSGVARFTYTIGDGRGGSATAIVTVVVGTRPNRPPVAVDDAATTAFGVPVMIAVLANDSDADGDALSIVSLAAPANGTAVIAGNAIVYTPNAGFAGADAFRYTISDGRGGSASADVAITVAPRPNQPPVAVDDAATTPFGQPVAIPVLANDSDPDGDALSISGVTAPANGSVSAANGVVTYTPAAGFSGTDRFTYTIDDGHGGSAGANVTVTVAPRPNRPPVANDDAATAAPNQPVTIDVLANDSDPDGDALTIVAVGTPTFGTAAIVGNEIVYTPPLRFFGLATFTYTIDDGRGGTASATVSVTVQ